MDWALIFEILNLGAASGALAGVMILLFRQQRLADQVAAARSQGGRNVTVSPPREGRPMIRVGDRWYRPSARVTDPPMVGDVTVRDMLVHLNPERDNVWADVVTEFYTRGLAVPQVAAYFYRTDRNRQEGHFLRALDLVTSKGITAGTVDYLRKKHARITTPDGTPITGAIYDAVIETLVGVLRDARLPEQGIAALAKTIEPIRAEIVRA